MINAQHVWEERELYLSGAKEMSYTHSECRTAADCRNAADLFLLSKWKFTPYME